MKKHLVFSLFLVFSMFAQVGAQTIFEISEGNGYGQTLQFVKKCNSGDAVVTREYVNRKVHEEATFAIGYAVRVMADSVWGLQGNSGTSAIINFLDTIGFEDQVFKTDGTERMRIKADAKILASGR